MNELTQRLADFARDSPLQRLSDPFPEPVPIQFYLKRDDLLHPQVSGNKWRKLKYNLIDAQRQHCDTLLTFGGAYSNHLYATAAAGQLLGFQTIGVVRGDELRSQPLNATLAFCQSCGMKLHFVSRDDYRRKEEADFLNRLQIQGKQLWPGQYYVLPEGGTNERAVQGTAEIMPELIAQLGYAPAYVGCAVGTGGTWRGLLTSAPATTTVLGFLAVKGTEKSLLSGLPRDKSPAANCQLLTEYNFGGYAKTTPELINFIRVFERRTGIRVEQVYTGKLLFGIYDLARRGFFPPGATVVALHTGGLQGRSPALDDVTGTQPVGVGH